jgi:hypothetical protein
MLKGVVAEKLGLQRTLAVYRRMEMQRLVAESKPPPLVALVDGKYKQNER